ncbi:hypothetical protein FQZ97_1183870 [compost metagenome]
MGALQETQIVQRMHGRQRRRSMIGRRLDVEAQLAGGAHQAIQARRHFLRRAHLATGKIGLRMMKLLVVVEKCLHAC